jgi:ribosomal protein L37AE/L43A
MSFNPKLKNQIIINGQYKGTCPFCNHHSNKFFMSIVTNLWDCKNCGLSGNWFQYKKNLKDLVQIVFNVDEEPVELKKERTEKLEVDWKLINERIEKGEMRGESHLPTGVYLLEDKGIAKRAYRYLRRRDFNDRDIEKNSMIYCFDGKYFNRILIPVVMFNKVFGFLGRWVPLANEKPQKKYRNSEGTHFSLLLWNYDNLQIRKPVVAVEGIFSGIRVDKNVVATFGKKMSEQQANLIAKKSKELVLLFDSDAKPEVVKNAEKYLGLFKEVRGLFLEMGDPDELNISYEKALDESVIITPKRYFHFTLK